MSKILFYVFIGIGLFFLIFFLYYRAKISKINAELRRIQRSNELLFADLKHMCRIIKGKEQSIASVPLSLRFDKNLLPYNPSAEDSFRIFLPASGHRFHANCRCSLNYGTHKEAHLYQALWRGYSPCAKCASLYPSSIPEWYKSYHFMVSMVQTTENPSSDWANTYLASVDPLKEMSPVTKKALIFISILWLIISINLLICFSLWL